MMDRRTDIVIEHLCLNTKKIKINIPRLTLLFIFNAIFFCHIFYHCMLSYVLTLKARARHYKNKPLKQHTYPPPLSHSPKHFPTCLNLHTSIYFLLSFYVVNLTLLKFHPHPTPPPCVYTKAMV